MAIQTRIYGNGGTGGAVDYTTIIATVSGSSYSPTALANNSDWTFAVRSYDTVTGLEERNIDGTYRIVVGATGANVTAVPASPYGMTVTPVSGGNLLVSWYYLPTRAMPIPTGFHVYAASPTLTLPGPAPVGTVAYLRPGNYTYTLTGFAAGATVQVIVRAYNATGEDRNTTTVSSVPVASSTTAPEATSTLAGGAGLGAGTGDTGLGG